MLRGEEEVHKSLEEALHETGYQLGNGRASFHAEAAQQDVKATLSWGYANIDDLRARKLYMDPDFLPFRLLETILMLKNFQSMKRASNRTLRDHMYYHEYGPHLSGWDSSQHDRLLNALHQCNVNVTGISYNGTELMAENETGIRADTSARRPKGSEDELYLRDWEFQLVFRLPLYLGLMQRY
ncbi:hypothetical protein CEUSTIGMA_g12303.t1 [Chlamydomonas eustigma]|uniref:Uncharacterized protein n=1 Tax=Chlamydomonas eustigma TaxID=1157962 RepID=A0A250XPM5_9CHLO|nr:hypothetical protein CEUSTIGMA_g12303.t1 [Chlamydomonas eustigma]|eukprot:GAX84882.1 hypothetical protein CEUSTIGMA_g12303.t1 [Chlamydomonas eustigma]